MRDQATTYAFDEFVSGEMQDARFRAEYDALEDEFAFIRQLIELRHQQGLTQAQLAERVGTRQPSISRLEHGELGSFEFLHRVAEALGVRIEIRLRPKSSSSS
jgi:predicted XRE-type DNA-binding protein